MWTSGSGSNSSKQVRRISINTRWLDVGRNGAVALVQQSVREIAKGADLAHRRHHGSGVTALDSAAKTSMRGGSRSPAPAVARPPEPVLFTASPTIAAPFREGRIHV